MTREVKKGMTIIHTADEHIGIQNKNGCKGVSAYGNRFRVEITIGHKHEKKYLVGIFDTLPDAIKARKIAEAKKYSGCLESWLASKPHGNSEAYQKFWEIEFERLMENENSKRNR